MYKIKKKRNKIKKKLIEKKFLKKRDYNV